MIYWENVTWTFYLFTLLKELLQLGINFVGYQLNFINN